MDWLDLLAVQGTLKSLFQHHSSKASILQRSAFFMVQLLHPYIPGGSDSKESACSVEDPGLTLQSGRSPGEGNGYPLQCSCLKNSMDRGAWQATDQLKELDMTERLTHTSLIYIHAYVIPSKTLSSFSDYTHSADGE